MSSPAQARKQRRWQSKSGNKISFLHGEVKSRMRSIVKISPYCLNIFYQIAAIEQKTLDLHLFCKIHRQGLTVFSDGLISRQLRPVNLTFTHRAFRWLRGKYLLSQLLAHTCGAIAFTATTGDKLLNETVVIQVAAFYTPCNNLIVILWRSINFFRSIFPITGAASFRRSSCSL